MSYGLLSPKVDFVFKKIFGNEQHPNILISFLNAVLNQKDVITSVKILNTDIDKEHIDDKYSRLDIKATTNNKEHINIEIQVKNEYNMVKRSMYYWSKMYESQIIEGDDYDKLARTVCINILDFKCLKNDRFHNFYRLKEVETNEELTDIQELHFIELPKYKGVSEDEDISNMLEIWTTFIKNPESKVIEKLELSKEEIKDAKYELLRISSSSKERELYERRKESLLNKVSALKNAEEKGQRKKAMEIARNLLDILDNETISLKTGLSIEDIKKLRNDIN
ncbi:Rpn family recombination-promoting nuclease/putative transposase [Romboutsia maritimum]|uniref:Rpn family recombination-promoting nuclease/putative transposase n=1 Tax=Romboutsia maritimum TaxID=2020948 RepID=A0A371IR31_9FIRM|nr:Rpn family recombination-promoting nuclease/putative transposase [Romboutsia maritimum]RDY22928.1 Rpn family recombination-promoting nuclease/putative transposase [Romboutsia maritimum]